eukprot:2962471-Pyramimonas_sp.AAC.1
MAPTMLQEAPGPPQDGHKWPQSFPRPESFQNLGDTNVFGFRAFSVPAAPRWLQERPQGSQKGFKRAPRGDQAQE